MVWFLDVPSLMSSGIGFPHPPLWASIPEARDRTTELKKRDDRILECLKRERRVECGNISKNCTAVGAGFKFLCLK